MGGQNTTFIVGKLTLEDVVLQTDLQSLTHAGQRLPTSREPTPVCTTAKRVQMSSLQVAWLPIRKREKLRASYTFSLNFFFR